MPVGPRRVGGVGRHPYAIAVILTHTLETRGRAYAVAAAQQRTLSTHRWDKKMYDTLKRQDYLYTLLTRGNDGSEARVVQSIVGFLHVPEAPEAALQRLEKEDIRILSLTVTEKGYYRTPDGGLDINNALVKEDLNDWSNGLKQPKTAPGLICTVLLRRRGKAGPLTVMSCDNLPLNGNTARDSVLAFARIVDQDLAAYIAEEVPFPNAMVDRITPVTKPEQIDNVCPH